MLTTRYLLNLFARAFPVADYRIEKGKLSARAELPDTPIPLRTRESLGSRGGLEADLIAETVEIEAKRTYTPISRLSLGDRYLF